MKRNPLWRNTFGVKQISHYNIEDKNFVLRQHK
ncbi:MAG: hypothetical protein BACB_03937 [Bacteroides thetaiotaomicron]